MWPIVTLDHWAQWHHMNLAACASPAGWHTRLTALLQYSPTGQVSPSCDSRMLEVSLSSSISSSSSNGIFSLLPSAWPVLLLDGTCTLDEPLKVIARRKPQKLPGHLVRDQDCKLAAQKVEELVKATSQCCSRRQPSWPPISDWAVTWAMAAAGGKILGHLPGQSLLMTASWMLVCCCKPWWGLVARCLGHLSGPAGPVIPLLGLQALLALLGIPLAPMSQSL